MQLVPLDKKLLARVEYQFNDQELTEYRLMMDQRKAVAQGEMDRAEERKACGRMQEVTQMQRINICHLFSELKLSLQEIANITELNYSTIRTIC